MPSRSPDSLVEILEVRCVPARLIGGPFPAEFGADLTLVPAPPVELLNEPVTAFEGGFGLPPSLELISLAVPLGAVVFTGGGTLQVTNPAHVVPMAPTFEISGGTLSINSGAIFGSYGGTLSLGGQNYFGSSIQSSVIINYDGSLTLSSGSLLFIGRAMSPITLPEGISLPIAPGAVLDINLSPEAPGISLTPFGGRITSGSPV